MAGVYGSVLSGEVVCLGGSANTVVLVRAQDNHPIKVRGYSIFFKGVSATAEPATIEIKRATTNGTMTISHPVETSGVLDVGVAPQANGWAGATVNPTAGDTLQRKAIHPQGGYEVILPMGQEIFVPGSKGLMLQVTADATVNAIAEMMFEE